MYHLKVNRQRPTSVMSLLVYVIILYNVCAVPWGVISTGGYHEYRGGYLEYRGGVQYCEGYHDNVGDILSTVGVFSTVEVFSTVGDAMSTVGSYLEYRGGFSVPWGIS